jgi:3-hydroxypropanoate dehydrogenase
MAAIMSHPRGIDADQLFHSARTAIRFLSKPVPDSVLVELYERMRWAPTSANCNPLRVLFVRSPEAKARLLACLAPGNVAKTQSAPVTAILAMDMRFHDQLPRLFPHADAKSWFEGNEQAIRETAMRNSSLQGAYFILAARSLGLDCGPMSGFDPAAIEAAFLMDTGWKVNFLCNLGHGDASALHPRLPRLSFEEACKLI